MMVFDGESGRWAKFRRALRREDQEVLDELFASARRHVASFAYSSLALPMEGVLLAMLIGERRRLKALEERLELLLGNGQRADRRPADDQDQRRDRAPGQDGVHAEEREQDR